jgi:hypothetical protein
MSSARSVFSFIRLAIICGLAAALIGGCGSDDSNPAKVKVRDVDLTQEVSFSAEKSLFLKAQLVEPFADDPVMRVDMPDRSVIYRELNTNVIWKETIENGIAVKSHDIAEDDLRLVKALNLDTGWQPPSGPLQVRFSLIASEGKVKSDMTGDLSVTCQVGSGATTQAQIGWTGRENEGALKIEGGLEIVSKFRFNVLGYSWEQEIPNLPNADWGVFNTEEFTPFALGQSVNCRDDIATAHIPVVPVGLPGVASINAGAAIGGYADADLTGISISGNCGERAGMIVDDAECCQMELNTSGNNLIQCSYDNDTRFRWVMDIEPELRLTIDLGLWDDSWGLGITHIPITIMDETFTLNYNSPELSVDLSTLK